MSLSAQSSISSAELELADEALPSNVFLLHFLFEFRLCKFVKVPEIAYTSKTIKVRFRASSLRL